jgi:hypothetical protein
LFLAKRPRGEPKSRRRPPAPASAGTVMIFDFFGAREKVVIALALCETPKAVLKARAG